MLKLITFKPCLGVRAPSPFALKADALLAMSGLPYERVFGDLRKAPRGKLPVLDDNGKLIPDSGLIQRYLETEKGIDFDGGLTKEQLASATAIRGMLEYHFYFIAANFRWGDHPEAIQEAFFDLVPKPLRRIVFKGVDRTRSKTMYLQGTGRYTRDELIASGTADIDAMAILLGNKPYLFGDRPTSIDASLFGALENVITFEVDTPLKQAAIQHDNLVAYCDRFRGEFFDGRD